MMSQEKKCFMRNFEALDSFSHDSIISRSRVEKSIMSLRKMTFLTHISRVSDPVYLSPERPAEVSVGPVLVQASWPWKNIFSLSQKI